MNKGFKLSFVASAVILALFSGCGYDNEGKNVVGDNLLISADTFKPVVDVPRAAIQAGMDAKSTGQKALLGVKAYKVNYMTTDDNGKSIEASGLITIPDLTPEFLAAYKANKLPGLENKKHDDFTLSIVSDQHGTVFKATEAPTSQALLTHAPNSLSTAFSSAALFMTVQPDYIGVGDTVVSHPFVLEKSLANATADMIEAAITFANKAGLPINGQVFLSGYSEGGYATMAAAKEIQENRPNINLKAVAPMAGPYDMDKIGLGAISSTVMAYPPYLAYVIKSYDEVYSDVDRNDIIVSDYASKLDSVFNGEHNTSVAYMMLPNVITGGADGQNPNKLFKEEFIAEYKTNPDTPLRKHFVQNSPINWKPEMPMKLLHCTNDMVIPYAMSELAIKSFKEQGATQVELIPINNVTAQAHSTVHSQCGIYAYAQVIPWFASIRKGGK